MSSHDATVLGYALVVAACVVLQVLSLWSASRVPSFTALLRRVMRGRRGRVGVITAWAWLGLHFFAR
jgi:Family of unknown function (DUF6186)